MYLENYFRCLDPRCQMSSFRAERHSVVLFILVHCAKLVLKAVQSTNASNVSIFINPYENIEGIYGSEQISRYLTNESIVEKLPPHIYATANDALNKLKLFKRKQSILLTGVSGSGKTQNCENIVDFLCQESNSKNVVDIFFNEEMQQTGGKISYHLLEAHRTCGTNPNESNFHVFYTLLHGLSTNLLNNICLDKTTHYRYLPDRDLIFKTNDNTCLDTNFNLLEKNLSKLGFTMNDKKNIYSVLSAILNLGNVEYEKISSDESCSIKIESRKYLCSAAALLNINEVELEEVLTSHTREVCGQRIISPLSKTAAENTKDGLAKLVYEKLFGQIMQFINNHLFQSSSSNHSIGILDIAGFEHIP
ncbi:myosin heavy chain 95F-like [Sitodiplosis mosellana]|uniref:myosin heavy chain 95F-like n=1 Tax=Sitodiplosis mosellana TaxID=263140 RepID=UPI002444FD97|nr:myosin heavy chain 95F-like [Sitodiplosis mosellana]